MSRIVLDAAALSKLTALLQSVEICDDSGRVVGQFTPTLDPEKRKALEPQISEEEIQRRKQEKGGRTLAEIMADLEKTRMNYHVIWLSVAEQELADLWLDPAYRAAVTRAANLLDQRLQRNAPDEGESRPDNARIAFEAPLGLLFTVDLAKREVRVLHVWRFLQRNP